MAKSIKVVFKRNAKFVVETKLNKINKPVAIFVDAERVLTNNQKAVE